MNEHYDPPLYYTGENGNAHKSAQEIERSVTVARIRASEGNIRYEYFFPMNDPETVLLIDCWENRAAIDRRHASPRMDIIAALRKKYDLRMRMERYLSDESGLSPADEKFLRW